MEPRLLMSATKPVFTPQDVSDLRNERIVVDRDIVPRDNAAQPQIDRALEGGTLVFTLNDLSKLNGTESILAQEWLGADEGELLIELTGDKKSTAQPQLTVSSVSATGVKTVLGDFELPAGENVSESVFALTWSDQEVTAYVDGQAVGISNGHVATFAAKKDKNNGNKKFEPVKNKGSKLVASVDFHGAPLSESQVAALYKANSDKAASERETGTDTSSVTPLSRLSAGGAESFGLQIQPLALTQTVSGGTQLIEDSDLVTEYRYAVDITAQTGVLAIGYQDLIFDTADIKQINDAFEVALLDANDNPVTSTVGEGRDAFFNWTEGEQPLLAVGAGHDSVEQTLGVDVSHLVGQTVYVVARLVNNDTDNTTTVTIRSEDTGTGDPRSVLWGIDEDDSHLFAVWDRSDPVGSYVDYGALQIDNQGTLVDLEHVSAMAVDAAGVAYFTVNQDVIGNSNPLLVKIDTTLLDPAQSMVATLVGEVTIAGTTLPTDQITGLDFDANGDLYALYHDNDTNAVDRLLVLDPSDASVLQDKGEISGTIGSASPVTLEAEAGTLDTAGQSIWTTVNDSSASGGVGLEIATGNNSTANPPVDGYLTMSFNVAEAGDYLIRARVKSVPGGDSFWVRVDGGTFVRWNGFNTSGQWAEHDVYDSDQTGTPTVEFNLTAGTHTVTFAYREDGTGLDQVSLVPTGGASELDGLPLADSVLLEAQNTTNTTPAWMQTSSDPDASGGSYVQTASGFNQNSTPPGSFTDYARYEFDTGFTGDHRVWGRVNMSSTSDNSFWARVDGGAWLKWSVAPTGGDWEWHAVFDTDTGSSSDVFDLAGPGPHTLDIAYREDGAKLDQLLVTPHTWFTPGGNNELKVLAGEDLTFDTNGDLLVGDADDGRVYRVDPGSGDIVGLYSPSVLSDPASGIPLEAMAIDPETGDLLISDSQFTDESLVSVDSNGVAQQLFSAAVLGATDIEALDFHTTTAAAPARSTLLIADADDGQLNIVWNTAQPDSTAVNLGPAFLDDGQGVLQPLTGLGSTAIDANGLAYFIHEGTVGNYSGTKLLSLDLAALTDGQPATTTYLANLSSLASGASVVGLDIHPTSGVLYAVVNDPAAAAGTLVTINPSTGALTTGGSLTDGTSINATDPTALAFNAAGASLYVADATADAVYLINPATGQITATHDNDPFNGLTAASGAYFSALSLDPETGDLLGVDPVGDRVVQINPGNGANVERFGVTAQGLTNAQALAFYPALDLPTSGGGGTPITPPAIGGENLAPDSPRSATFTDAVVFDDLSDVTGAFSLDYENTAYNADTQELYAGLSISKTGSQNLRGKVLLAITNLDQAGAEWLNFGTIASGLPGFEGINTPYLDITHLLEHDANGFIVDSAAIDNLLLRFENPGGERFDFDAVIFSQLNQPPVFITSPFLPGQDTVTVRLGNTFVYDAVAEDPDQDAVTFSLGDGAPAGVTIDSATGQITWDTTSVAEGGYMVTVVADDSFGGVATQRVPINVLITTQNLPPQFTTDPVTVAYAGVEYTYDADAIDPESDVLTFSSTLDPGTTENPFVLDTATGVVNWTPDASLVGQTVTVTLNAADGNVGTDTQTYDVMVMEDPANHPPVIISAPSVQHTLPVAVPLLDPVTPDVIEITLNENQTVTLPVSINLSADAVSADIVFVVDTSGSMEGEHEWLGEVISQVDAALESNGITGNRYGLVGYTDDATSFALGGNLFGTAAEFAAAAETLNASGSTENAYEALSHAITNYTFRADAAAGIVLVSDDEAQDYTSTAYTTLLNSFERDISSEYDDIFLTAVIGVGDISADDEQGNAGLNEVKGLWSLNPDSYQAAPEIVSGEAIATLEHLHLLPDPNLPLFSRTSVRIDFEIQDLGPGYDRNAMLIFDYQSETDYKFFSASADDDYARFGHRDASGFTIDAEVQAPLGFDVDVNYSIWIDLAFKTVDSSYAQISTGGIFLSHQWIDPKVSYGSIGIGTLNSAATFNQIDIINTPGVSFQTALPEFIDTYKLGSDGYRPALAIGGNEVGDLNPTVLFADGMGGYSLGTENVILDTTFPSSLIEIADVKDFIDLAWETDSFAWNLGKLRYATDGSDLASSFSLAFAETLAARALESLEINLTSNSDTVAGIEPDPSGGLGDFLVTITGDGRAHSFDLEFIQGESTVRGSIPVAVNAAYTYDLKAIDPDDDSPLVYAWVGDSYGATLIDGRVLWNPENVVPGTYDFAVEVSDGRGGSDIQAWTVAVADEGGGNAGPVIETSTVPGATAMRDYETLIQATDADGDALSYYLIDGPLTGDAVPEGLEIDRNTGTLSWFPSKDLVGQQAFTVLVADGRGGEASQTFTIDIGPAELTNFAPQIHSAPPVSAEIGGRYTYAIEATDPNSDPLSYELVVGPAGMAVSSNDGTVTWLPSNGQFGDHRVVLRVSDGKDGAAIQEFLINVSANSGPVLTVPTTPSVALGSLYTDQVVATDPDSPDANLVFVKLSGPEDLTVDSDGSISWNTAGGTAGAYDIIVGVSDSHGGIATGTFTLRVTQANSAAPVITNAPAGVLVARTTIQAGGSYIAQVEAYDPDGDAITYALVGAPSGMSIDGSGLITWATDFVDLFGANGPNYDGIQAIVSDGVNETAAVFSIEVTRQTINQAPTITSTPTDGAVLGAVYLYQATANDSDNDVLAWTLIDGPDGASIDGEKGLLTWLPNTDQLGPQLLTVRVFDVYGVGQTQTFTVEVRATNLPPQIGFWAPTQAYVGQNDYSFTVQVVDPEGADVTLAVTDDLGVPISWLDGVVDHGDGIWTVSSSSVGAAGSYTVQLIATDESGQTDSQSFMLNVASNASNQPMDLVNIDRTPGPSLYDPADAESIAILPVAVGELYTYTLEFSDPDGDDLAFALGAGSTLIEDTVNVAAPETGKASFEKNGSTLTVRWRPSVGQDGQSHLVVVEASDGSYTLSVPISATVRSNSAPVLQAMADADAPVGGEMRVQAQATDAESDTLTFALVDGVDAVPAGMSIDALTGLILWSPTTAELDAGQPKTYTVNVVVTDAFGATSGTQALTVTVAQDTTAPQVVVTSNQSTPLVGETIVLTVQATDAAGIAAQWLTINGQQVAINEYGQANHTVADNSPIVVQGFALDVNGLEGSSGTLTLTPYTASEVPSISVTGPTQDVPVKQYVEITGVIDDPDFASNGAAVHTVNYRAYLIHAATGDTLLLGEGSTAQRIDGEIGIAVDPTLIANGSYVIRLQATNAADLDAPGAEPVLQLDTWIEIDSDVAKVGNFALSFTDLSTSVGGIPIVITRSYDTIDAQEDGDFGYGWTLDIATGGLEVSNLGYSEQVAFGGTAFTEQPYQFGTRLDFTLPGGQEMGFTAVPNSYSKGGRAGGILGFAEIFSVAFQPDGDSLGNKLEFIGGESVRLDNDNAEAFGLESGTAVNSTAVVSDGISLNQPGVGASSGEGLPFNPVTTEAGWDFRLTTKDGAQYTYDSKTGRLLNVVDREGNRLSFGSNSLGDVITSQDESGLILGQVQITRNNQGRVTEITDLEDPETDKVTYTYDGADGNLETVTDRSGVTTTFAYNEGISGLPDHYLTSITNELGVKVLQAKFFTTDKSASDYDPAVAGRLKGLVDASGAAANFGYTMSGADVGLPGATIESVADANNIPTEVVRDAAGNTLRTIQQIDDPATVGLDYLISVLEYDADDNQTAVWQPFTYNEATADNSRFTAPPAIKQAGSSYDRFGRPETITDALGNTTTYTYDTFGNPTTILDALGNVTRNNYDSQTGRLTRTTDAEGNVTDYGYDPDGNLESITQYDDNGDPVTSSVFDYDNKGRLTSTTDVNNVTRYFAYDGDGNQTHSWSFKDNVTTANVTSYDEEGRVLTSSQYTLSGSLVEITDVKDEIADPGNVADWSTFTTYDALGRVKTSTDRFGTVTENFYDARGNVYETRTQTTTSSGAAAFVVTRTAYDTNGRAIASIDPFLVRVDNGVDIYLDPTDDTQSAPDNTHFRITHTLYDDAGRVTETRRVAGVPLTVETDPLNTSLFQTTFDTNYATSATLSSSFTRYDNAGRVDETQTTEGLITKFVYDVVGRQERVVIDPNDTLGMFAETTYTYDKASRQETVTDPLGRVTRFVYDKLGRVTHTIQEGNDNEVSTDLVTQTLYDSRGRRVAEIDALDRRTDFDYDDAGRLEKITLPGVDDALTPETDLVRPFYEYGYDAYGNQTSITDPQGRVTEFGFDAQNRQTSRTLPLGVESSGILGDFTESMEHYTADNPAAGEYYGLLKSSTDFEGNTVTYSYDPYGRAEAMTYRDSGGVIQRIVNTTYDGLGRVKQVTDSGNQGDGITTHAYDAEGRLVERATPQGTLTYEYDPETGRQTAVEGVSTRTEYDYDEQDRLIEVKAASRLGANPNELTEYVFNRFGELDWEVGPNGVTRDNQYDNLGRLNRIVHFNDTNGDGTRQSGETLIAQFDYTYDAAGNRLSSTEIIGGLEQVFTYEYDGLNRLTKETLTSSTDQVRNYTTEYKFDLSSNRVQLIKDAGSDGYSGSGGDETIDYVYDTNDRLLSETSSTDGLTTYGYGPNAIAGTHGGDWTVQTIKTEANGTVTTQAYDVMGRLQSVTIDATASGGPITTESYTYSTSGIRTSRTVNGVTTVFLYDLQNPTGYAQILEQGIDDGTGSGTAGDGRLHADEVDTAFTVGYDVITQAAVGQVLHLLYDIHGSTRALTDASGVIVDDPTAGLQVFSYDAYGNAIGFTNAQALTTLLYSGEFTNANTGSQYLRARYYNAANGRFNRLDPYFGRHADPLSFHKYQYTHGNPITGIDPSGNISLNDALLTVGISTTVGGIVGYAVTGSAKGAFYGAYAGLTTSTAAVLILANPYNKSNPLLIGADFQSLLITSVWGLVIGAVDAFGSAFEGNTFKEANLSVDLVLTGALRGLAKTNEGFIASYGIVGVTPGLNNKAGFLATNILNKLDVPTQKAAAAVIGVVAKSLTSGTAITDPGKVAVDALKGGIYAYVFSRIGSVAAANAAEGYIFSLLGKRIERAGIQLADFWRS